MHRSVARRAGCCIVCSTCPAWPIAVHAICVHLGLRESHRHQQLDLLCKLIERDVPPDAPLVVAGDFNDWRLVAHERLHRCAGLQEVFVSAFGRAARTFPARFPVLRLDRIYARHARVQRPLRLPPRPWSHLSDHAPLAAQLEFEVAPIVVAPIDVAPTDVAPTEVAPTEVAPTEVAPTTDRR